MYAEVGLDVGLERTADAEADEFLRLFHHILQFLELGVVAKQIPCHAEAVANVAGSLGDLEFRPVLDGCLQGKGTAAEESCTYVIAIDFKDVVNILVDPAVRVNILTGDIDTNLIVSPIVFLFAFLQFPACIAIIIARPVVCPIHVHIDFQGQYLFKNVIRHTSIDGDGSDIELELHWQLDITTEVGKGIAHAVIPHVVTPLRVFKEGFAGGRRFLPQLAEPR